MSKILQELIKAADLSTKRGESPKDQKIRLVQAIGEISEDEWNGLSEAAQNWFNEAADLVNAKKAPPDFPDEAKEEKAEEKTTTRRRSAAAEEKEEKAYEPEVDDEVEVKTKRGAVTKGKVVEVDDKIVVVDDGQEEVEFTRDRLESIIKIEAEKPTSTRRKKADEEPEAPAVAEPAVGDEIEAVTSRDKVVSGKVVEVSDDLVVFDDGKGEVELTPSKLKSLKITKAAAAKSGRRGSAEKKDEPKDKEEGHKKTSKADNGGISAGQRMRELIVADFEATKEDIAKAMKKDGLTYRDNTLDLVYADTHKIIRMLKEAKKLK